MSYRAQEKPWHYIPVFNAILKTAVLKGFGSATSFSSSRAAPVSVHVGRLQSMCRRSRLRSGR